MRKTCNRLLITLVLFGVLSAAAAHAQTVSIGKLPAEPVGKSVYDPPVAPTAGEPDAGDHSPQRTDLRGTSIRSQSAYGGTLSPRTIELSSWQALRWAFVIWMARYLNQLP